MQGQSRATSSRGSVPSGSEMEDEETGPRPLNLFNDTGEIVPFEDEPETINPFEKVVGSHLKGHLDAIKAMCYDASTSRLYTASWDNTLCVWSIAARMLMTVLPHADWVNAVALIETPIKYVVTGCEDGNVTVWSANDFLVVHQVKPGYGAITHLCVNGDVVFAASLLNVYAISLSTGSVIREYRGEKIDNTAIVSCDEQLFCGLEDGKILCWDILGVFVLRELTGHVGQVRCLTVATDLNSLFSAGDDGKVRCWAISTGVCTRTIQVHRKPILSMTLHYGIRENFLYTAGLDGKVKCLRLANGRSAAVRSGVQNAICAIQGTDDIPDLHDHETTGVRASYRTKRQSAVKGAGQLAVGDPTGALQLFSLTLTEKQVTATLV